MRAVREYGVRMVRGYRVRVVRGYRVRVVRDEHWGMTYSRTLGRKWRQV